MLCLVCHRFYCFRFCFISTLFRFLLLFTFYLSSHLWSFLNSFLLWLCHFLFLFLLSSIFISILLFIKTIKVKKLNDWYIKYLKTICLYSHEFQLTGTALEWPLSILLDLGLPVPVDGVPGAAHAERTVHLKVVTMQYNILCIKPPNISVIG